MTKKILISSSDLFYQKAFLEDDTISYLSIEPRFNEAIKMNIYAGVIERVETSLSAVFVNIGTGKSGFLSSREIAPGYFGSESNDLSSLKVGQKIIVQVTKDRFKNKGVSLTTHLSISGYFLVLSLYKNGSILFSRNLSQKDKNRINNMIPFLSIPKDVDLIFRTAAMHASSINSVQRELNILLSLKKSVTENINQVDAPCLIYKDSSFISRTFREENISTECEIIIDQKDIFDEAINSCRLFRPALVKNIEYCPGPSNIMHEYGINQEITNLCSPVVNLKSGGSLFIEHTEALTAIDVNSSRYLKGSNIAETAYNINMEACEVIAKQLRLREIGGIIIVDFIDMDDPENQKSIEKNLACHLAKDKAKICMTTMTKLGLIQISRQHIAVGIKETLFNKCPHCHGKGIQVSAELTTHNILSSIKETLDNTKDKVNVVIYTSSHIHFILSNLCHKSLRDIESWYQTSVYIYPYQMSSNQYFIKTYNKRDSVPYISQDSSNYRAPEHFDITSIIRNFWFDVTQPFTEKEISSYKTKSRVKLVIEDSEKIQIEQCQDDSTDTKTGPKDKYQRVLANKFNSKES